MVLQGLSKDEILNLLGYGTVSDIQISDKQLNDNFTNEELDRLLDEFAEEEDRKLIITILLNPPQPVISMPTQISIISQN